jgi:quinol-cytochrome oxidoreductase complex cytochrome b subunit
MDAKIRDWFRSQEMRLRKSIIAPSLRKTRLYLWIIGVIIFSLMAVCWPLITGSGNKTPAFTFGGVEFILAGFVIMVAGVTDLLSVASDRRPRARSLTILVGILLGSASLGFSARLADDERVPSAGYITMAVALFILTVICGTYAVWIAERGD